MLAGPVVAGKYPDMDVDPRDVVRVYDGDTFYIDIPNTNPLFGKSIGVRINTIDTPEMRSSCKILEKKLAEKALAKRAKLLLQKRISKAKHIKLVNPARDKYFRILAEVDIDGRMFSDELVAAGLAKPYDGGTKEGWCK